MLWGGLAPPHVSAEIAGWLTPIASLQISFINFFLLDSALNEPGQPNPVACPRAALEMLQGFFLLHVTSGVCCCTSPGHPAPDR